MKRYKLINNVFGWTIFLIASTVYLLTMEATASFWDCGEFILSAYKLEVGHPPGAPFFMLIGNIFSQFASDPSKVAIMVNASSAIFSAFTILFLFWTITHIARRIILKKGDQELSTARIIMVMGSGVVGALVYTFSDTFWFSAVEGEVYAFSSLFTALVFWLILKWEEVADKPHADRWIVLIAYLMGISIGVHLLNLLCIPAIVLVYYFRKVETPTFKGFAIAIASSFALIVIMMYGVVQGLVEVCGWFELFFVNTLGMPYNTGVYAYVLLIGILFSWCIWETMQTTIHPIRIKIAFFLSIILLGIPFMGSGYLLGIVIILALGIGLFYYKKINIKLINTIMISLMVIVIGYSSYALILIRSTADTPMNQNKPDNIFTLRSYLAREQYGDRPLLYGQTYISEVNRSNENNFCTPTIKEGAPTWSRVIKSSTEEKDQYFISNRAPEYQWVKETQMLFPRMYSSQPTHVSGYKAWANIKGETITYNRCGEQVKAVKPTFAENIRFFVHYQLNYMYWRYFMWNFSGRQNDQQGHGDLLKGNWISGIKFLDAARLGTQEDMPYDIAKNKAHNVYYMLPLLLGLLGIFYQIFSGKRGREEFLITFFLFFMTGLAIVIYLNQTPYQPRERDYAYAGSFYAYCIWIGLGVIAIARFFEKKLKLSPIIAGSVASLLALFVPIQMAGQNWDDHDRSQRTMARDFGINYLESCEENAIIFTNGDNDTFPLWYVQEVEGIRTDVRVCNTSYLQTDWYIDQMKRQAYESDPLPITWTRDRYIQGKRDRAYLFDIMKEPIDLGTALNFIWSDDPRYKRLSGIPQELDYIPSKQLIYRVDSFTVMQKKVISPEQAPLIEKEMLIDLSDKEGIGKEALTILDMLQTNNWERPIYFAITVDPEQFVRLSPYFQKSGMSYKVVPINTQKNSEAALNTEKMYDNVMNKFKWGGVDRPGTYIDENVMRMCKTYRISIFGELSSALIREGKREKALAVLDRCIEVLPPEYIEFDYSGFTLAENYLMLGEQKKGEELLNMIAATSTHNLRWYLKQRKGIMTQLDMEIKHNLAVLQNIISIGRQFNPDFGKELTEEFNRYLSSYSPQGR